MFIEVMHEILHALLDTLLVFSIILLIYFALSFVEDKLSKKLVRSNKFNPLLGAAVGLIPQCGFSIVAADMYKKKYITIGTVIAVFIATSDEALPILLSTPDKILSVIPFILLKFAIAIMFGYIIDLIFARHNKLTTNTSTNHEEVHATGCCHHEINSKEDNFIKLHVIHPLLHSLKICGYVLVINIIFNLLFYFIGEETIKNFLNQNVYLTPLLASLIGLIPNCAASVIITELYVTNALTFSATMAGLTCSSGLGLIYLLKDKKNIKNTLLIIALLLSISLLVGYGSLFIELLVK